MWGARKGPRLCLVTCMPLDGLLLWEASLPFGLPVPPSLGHSTQTAFRSRIPEREPRAESEPGDVSLFCSGLFSSPLGLSPPICPKHRRSLRNKSKVILCLYFCLSIHLSYMDSKGTLLEGWSVSSQYVHHHCQKVDDSESPQEPPPCCGQHLPCGQRAGPWFALPVTGHLLDRHTDSASGPAFGVCLLSRGRTV